VRISRESSIGAALAVAAWLTPVLTLAQSLVAVLAILGCVALTARRDLLLLRISAPLVSVSLFALTYYQRRSEGLLTAVSAMFVEVFSQAEERPLTSFAAMVVLGVSATLIQANYRRYWYAAFSAAGIPFGVALSSTLRPYSFAFFALVVALGTALTPLEDEPQSFSGKPRSRLSFLPVGVAVLFALVLSLGPGAEVMQRFGENIESFAKSKSSTIESALPVPESLTKKLSQDLEQGRITPEQLSDMLGANGLEAQLEAFSQIGVSPSSTQTGVLEATPQTNETLEPQETGSAGSTTSDATDEPGSDPGSDSTLTTDVAATDNNDSLAPGTSSGVSDSVDGSPTSVPVTGATGGLLPVGVTTSISEPDALPQPTAKTESVDSLLWKALPVLVLLSVGFYLILRRRRSLQDAKDVSGPSPIVAEWRRTDASLSLIAGEKEPGVSFFERHHRVRSLAPDLTSAHAELTLMADAELFGGHLPQESVARAGQLSSDLQERSSKRGRRASARSKLRISEGDTDGE
jgi:hypothetical protein